MGQNCLFNFFFVLSLPLSFSLYGSRFLKKNHQQQQRKIEIILLAVGFATRKNNNNNGNNKESKPITF